MRAARERDIHEELSEFLRANSEAARRVSPDTLRRAIDLGLARCEAYGFQQRASLGGYILLMFEVSPHFDSHPRIHAVLLDRNIPLERRVEALGVLISEQEWGEAARGV